MARVLLELRTKHTANEDFGLRPYRFIRLTAGVQFVGVTGALTGTNRAIVDTGAPWCVLPDYIWRPLEVEVLKEDARFGGINKQEVCQIPADSGIARGRFVDRDGNATGMRSFPAYLAKTDAVPLIVGFADLLEHFAIYFDHRAGEAWIEGPGDRCSPADGAVPQRG